MTLALLTIALHSGPAHAAPNFPLEVAGEMCDDAQCTPTTWTLTADGRIQENRTGMTGFYQWDKVTKTFTAGFSDFVGTQLTGTKEAGRPCIRGTWMTLLPGIDGTFWFCKA